MLLILYTDNKFKIKISSCNLEKYNHFFKVVLTERCLHIFRELLFLNNNYQTKQTNDHI